MFQLIQSDTEKAVSDLTTTEMFLNEFLLWIPNA